MRAALRLLCGTCCLALCLPLAACGPSGAPTARAKIRKEHAPRAAAIVLEDLVNHTRGLRYAANRIAAGFVKVQGEEQDRGMRQVLRLVRNPKRGVPELVISPMSFLAVVGLDGVVIARDLDRDKDQMKGMNLAKDFPSVRDALDGKEGYEVGEFKSLNEGGKPSVTIVMAAPARFQDKVVGAMVLGIPLWRLQQRISKQLQSEEAGKKDKSSVLWAYVYRGDELHMHGTPRDLDLLVPDGKARKAGLLASPGGYTGEVAQYGYWYGFGVRPVRVLGPDIGLVVFRMEAQ
jgi:hypothetical protein